MFLNSKTFFILQFIQVNVTHNLIKAYELLKHVVVPPQFATVEELKSFHSEEYIDFLRKINDLSEEELLDDEEEEMEKFGIGKFSNIILNTLYIFTDISKL